MTALSKRVLFVTPEMSDFVQCGGLGAVSSALPRALRSSYDIRVLVPGYPEVLAKCPQLECVGQVGAQAGLPACDVGLCELPDGLQVYVLLCSALYERPGTPYVDAASVDWRDNDVRFARLSSAAAEIAIGNVDETWSAHLLHCNDWPTALAAAYLRWRGSPIPSLLTIHNLAYQGLFGYDSLGRVAAPDSAFTIDGMEFYGQVSFLKGGIAFADHVTTVSATYAQEITRPEHGCGLHGLLSRRAAENRLTGILNGIDESWDPRVSPFLAASFDAGDWRGKRANGDVVRQEFGLAVSRGPLFSVVSRLVHQKGIDLVLSAGEAIVANGGQVVILGKGEPEVEAAALALAGRFPGQVGVRIGFEEALSRRMFAGSDFLLMPSRFEPCGLSQMYAHRFGTLPVAHRTGGLAETIEDGRSGFLFSEASEGAFGAAVGRAIESFLAKRRLNGMRRNAMSKDYGWSRSAGVYDTLYARVMGNRSVSVRAA